MTHLRGTEDVRTGRSTPPPLFKQVPAVNEWPIALPGQANKDLLSLLGLYSTL